MTFDESRLGYRLAKEVDILEKNPVLTPTENDLAASSHQYQLDNENEIVKSDEPPKQ